MDQESWPFHSFEYLLMAVTIEIDPTAVAATAIHSKVLIEA